MHTKLKSSLLLCELFNFYSNTKSTVNQWQVTTSHKISTPFYLKKSKKFKLLSWCIRINRLYPLKHFYIAKLFVCDTQYGYITKFWKKFPHTFNMSFSIFHATTMAYINRPLEHSKPISLKILTKERMCGSISLRLRW